MTKEQFHNLTLEATKARVLIQGDEKFCFLSRANSGTTIYSGCHYSAAKMELEKELVRRSLVRR